MKNWTAPFIGAVALTYVAVFAGTNIYNTGCPFGSCSTTQAQTAAVSASADPALVKAALAAENDAATTAKAHAKGQCCRSKAFLAAQRAEDARAQVAQASLATVSDTKSSCSKEPACMKADASTCSKGNACCKAKKAAMIAELDGSCVKPGVSSAASAGKSCCKGKTMTAGKSCGGASGVSDTPVVLTAEAGTPASPALSSVTLPPLTIAQLN